MADIFEFPKSEKLSLEKTKNALLENFIANGVDPAIAEQTINAFEKPLDVMQKGMPHFCIELDELNDLYLFSDLTKEQYNSFRTKFSEIASRAVEEYGRRANKTLADVFYKCMMIYAYELSKKT